MASTRSVLIVGGSGFVGTHLCMRLRDSFKVYATYHSRRASIPGVTFLPMRQSSRAWVKQLVYMARPEIVIYCAGTNNVETAEHDPRAADGVHTSLAGLISNVSDIFQPRFIYISNNYTFDGIRGNFHEDDVVLPGLALGKAKLGGENFIRSKSLNYAIVRSAPLFGRGVGRTPTWMDKIRIKLDRGERIELPNGEYHNMASIHGFTEMIEKVITSSHKNKVYHYGSLTRASMYEFGLEFAKRFDFDPSLITARKLSEQMTMTSRTHYDFSLNFTQAVELLKIKPLLLEQCLDLFEKELVAGL